MTGAKHSELKPRHLSLWWCPRVAVSSGSNESTDNIDSPNGDLKRNFWMPDRALIKNIVYFTIKKIFNWKTKPKCRRHFPWTFFALVGSVDTVHSTFSFCLCGLRLESLLHVPTGPFPPQSELSSVLTTDFCKVNWIDPAVHKTFSGQQKKPLRQHSVIQYSTFIGDRNIAVLCSLCHSEWCLTFHLLKTFNLH